MSCKAAEEKPRERKEEVDEPKEVLDVGKEVVEAVAPQGERSGRVKNSG